MVGPSFNFKISEKFEENGVEIDNDEDGIEGVETALVFGGGVHVGGFRVDLRYGIGLSNIIKDSEIEGFTGKNRVFSILVGFGSLGTRVQDTPVTPPSLTQSPPVSWLRRGTGGWPLW